MRTDPVRRIKNLNTFLCPSLYLAPAWPLSPRQLGEPKYKPSVPLSYSIFSVYACLPILTDEGGVGAMEEPGEQFNVVFALIFTGPASEPVP